MKKLYLDHNIIIELTSENISRDDLLINDEFGIFYSPAHIEEIAVSEKRDNIEKNIIEKDLEIISKLTLNKELLPNHGEKEDCNDGIYIKSEHPQKCYQRVVDQYQVNDEAEDLNEAVLSISKENNFFGNEPSKINNTTPEQILRKILDEVHITHKERFIFNYNNHIIFINQEYNINLEPFKELYFKFNDFRDNFFKILIIIEMLANLLEAHGYYYEKPNHKKQPLVEKARSRMHEVTHMIYASYCNRFITGDKKIFYKTKAIYSYLDIRTEVLYYNQKEKKLFTRLIPKPEVYSENTL